MIVLTSELELWSLLFFLNSEKFNNLAEFQSKYSDLKEQETILKLHDELKPYLLRRVKKDVEKVVIYDSIL